MQCAPQEDVMREIQALRRRAKRLDRPKEVVKLLSAAGAGALAMWLVLSLI